MIDLGTLAGLLEHRHRLDAYCPRCCRWVGLDLAAMVTTGSGGRQLLPVSVRCRVRGGLGRLQLRPYLPTRPRSMVPSRMTIVAAHASGEHHKQNPRHEAGDSVSQGRIALAQCTTATSSAERRSRAK